MEPHTVRSAVNQWNPVW